MAKKVILKDLNDIEVLPITRGELVLDASGNPALHSTLFLATDSLPGLMSSEDKYKLDNLENSGPGANNKVAQINTTTNNVYRLLFSETADDTDRTEKSRKSANLTFNPSTGVLNLTGAINANSGTLNDAIYFNDSKKYIRYNSGSYLEIFNETNSYSGLGLYDDGSVKVYTNSKWNAIIHSGNIGSQSVSHASTADKLKNKVKLWGLNFDGTKDIKGRLSIVSMVTYDPELLYGIHINGSYYNSNLTLHDIAIYSKNITTIGGGNVGINTVSPSERLDVNGNVKATAFIGNLDGTYINKLTGYTKATAIAALAATDSLNTALGKLEFKTDFIYNDLFGTDNDDVINKWHEIVDFVDSVAEGTDITDEFVTRKTSLTITGLKTFLSKSSTTGISLILKNSGWTVNMSTAMDFYNGSNYVVPNARIETKMIGDGKAGGTLIFYTLTKHASTNPNPNGLTERLRIDDNGITKVTGALTVTGDCDFSAGTVKLDVLNIPTSNGGTTFGPGSNGQVLKSNGTTVYWASDNNSNSWRAVQVNGTQIAGTGTGTYALNFISGTGITVAGTSGSSSAANSITITNAGVRSTTINGNYLRVNTNGTNADLTIPYASSAGALGTYSIQHFMTYDNGNNNYLAASFTNENFSKKAAEKYIEYWDSAGGWFNSRWGLVLAISGFHRVGSSDSYVLLGGGGHKALSDFATSNHTHNSLVQKDMHHIKSETYTWSLTSGTWYRIMESDSTSVADSTGDLVIYMNNAGNPCTVKLEFGICYYAEPFINSLWSTAWSGQHIKKARIVYKNPYGSQKAYIEVLAGLTTTQVTTFSFKGHGWRFITPVATTEALSESLTHSTTVNIVNGSKIINRRLSVLDRLGIGTSYPEYQLHATSNAKIASICLEYTDEINRYGGNLYLQHRGTIEGSQGSARTGNVFMVCNGGVATIGNVTSQEKLNVGGSILVNGSIRFKTSSAGTIGKQYSDTDTNMYNYIKINEATGGIQYYSGSWTGGDHTAHQFITASSNTPRLTIKNATGYVGIGTDKPAYKLEVAGSICGTVIYANRDGSTTAGGVSLYSNADPMTCGIVFRGTGTYGTHGYVTAANDWATYLTMSDTTNRGWIFRRGSTNVASISGGGDMAIGQHLKFSNEAHISTNRSTDYHYGYTFNLEANAQSIGMYSGPVGEAGGVVISPDGCLIYNSSDSGYNLQVRDKDLGSDLTNVATLTFGIEQTGHYAWSRGGFKKNGSDDSYVLLGGGGHKLESNLSVSSARTASRATTANMISHSTYYYSGNVMKNNTSADTIFGTDATANYLFPSFMESHPIFNNYADVINFTGYCKWGGTQLATEYNAINPRVAIRKYNQSRSNWGDWTELLSNKNGVRWGGWNGTFEGGTPASAVKSRFTASYMPDGNLLTYNTAGNEYTLLMTCRPDILHGSALKWGYPDRYIRILRFINGSAQTTDWEKIAAGYADSAGSATNASYYTLGPSSTFTNVWNCNTPDRIVYSDYGSSGRNVSNAPAGWYYGTLLELGHMNYRGQNSSLNLQLMWDVAHSTTNGGTLWFRGNCSTYKWAKNWCKVITDQNYSSYALPLSGGWINYAGQIYFKGLNQSTSTYATIGYRASLGSVMHHASAPHQNSGAFYIATNGCDSSNDWGGLAIDNEGVTVFGAGDTGSVFRVLNEDNPGDGPLFIVTKASGATVKYNMYAAHFYESSDQQLKTNIQEIFNSDKMPIIKEFDWKEDGSHSYGLIAQELEKQGYSELVSVKDDGYKTVNYSAALSLIVGKLQVKIRELEKEIEILKNKN